MGSKRQVIMPDDGYILVDTTDARMAGGCRVGGAGVNIQVSQIAGVPAGALGGEEFKRSQLGPAVPGNAKSEARNSKQARNANDPNHGKRQTKPIWVGRRAKRSQLWRFGLAREGRRGKRSQSCPDPPVFGAFRLRVVRGDLRR